MVQGLGELDQGELVLFLFSALFVGLKDTKRKPGFGYPLW